MENTADRYRRLRTSFADRVRHVDAAAWTNPSPCEEWTARELVAHVVTTQAMFEQLVGRSLHPGPEVGDDPLGAFTVATDQVQAHLDDPGTAAVEFDGFFGRTTFEAAVERFLCFDLVVHGWDLARATGQDEGIGPADVAWAHQVATGLGEAMRGSGAFREEVVLDDDAGAQDQLLAQLGRRP